MENAAAVLLGTSASDCPNPPALGTVCAVGALPDESLVDKVLQRLQEHDLAFLERTCEALARCRAEVVEHLCLDEPGASAQAAASDARGQRLQTACDLLQDVARAGNMYVRPRRW